MNTKPKSQQVNPLLAVLGTQPVRETRETAVIPVKPNVIDVRHNGSFPYVLPPNMMPMDIPFLAVPVTAVRGMTGLLHDIFDHTDNSGWFTEQWLVSTATAQIIDLCGKVALVKFDLLRHRILTVERDPILPIISSKLEVWGAFAEMDRLGQTKESLKSYQKARHRQSEYAGWMQVIAKRLIDYAGKPKRNRFLLELAVTRCIEAIDESALPHLSRDFAAFHLHNLLLYPENYI